MLFVVHCVDAKGPDAARNRLSQAAQGLTSLSKTVTSRLAAWRQRPGPNGSRNALEKRSIQLGRSLWDCDDYGHCARVAPLYTHQKTGATRAGPSLPIPIRRRAHP